MSTAEIKCPFCNPSQALELPKAGRSIAQCSKCPDIHYHRFPAMTRPSEAPRVTGSLSDEDATCFHHPDRKAVAVCVECGIFICDLCEVKDHHGNSLCLDCYTRGKSSTPTNRRPDKKGGGRIVWDRTAFGVALLGFCPYVTCLTAPAALFLALRYWKDHPCSVTSRGRGYYLAALLIASLQLLSMIAIIVLLIGSVL